MSMEINSRLIGQKIKSLRLSKHWTQEYLAERVGYEVRNLRRIETNGTDRLGTIKHFADIFEVSTLDILTEDVFCCKIKWGSLHFPHLIILGHLGLSLNAELTRLLIKISSLFLRLELLISLTLSLTILGAHSVLRKIISIPQDFLSPHKCLFLLSHLFVYAAFDFINIFLPPYYLQKIHWRSSPYNTYSNLLFAH